MKILKSCIRRLLKRSSIIKLNSKRNKYVDETLRSPSVGIEELEEYIEKNNLNPQKFEHHTMEELKKLTRHVLYKFSKSFYMHFKVDTSK